MPTRKFYIYISKRLQGSVKIVEYAGLTIFFGWFILMAAFKISGKEISEETFNIGGRLWFSSCVLISVILMAVSWFNPDRDLADRSPRESWHVVLLNLMLMMAIYTWFMN